MLSGKEGIYGKGVVLASMRRLLGDSADKDISGITLTKDGKSAVFDV